MSDQPGAEAERELDLERPPVGRFRRDGGVVREQEAERGSGPSRNETMLAPCQPESSSASAFRLDLIAERQREVDGDAARVRDAEGGVLVLGAEHE